MNSETFSPQRDTGLLCCFFLLFLSLSYAPGLAAEAPESFPTYKPRFYPFDGGEKAVYQASWLGIPVASAEIEMQPVLLDGKKLYRVKVQTRSWRYLDLIWKMRDSVESTFDAETFHPSRFVFRQRENRRRTDTTAVVEPGTKKWVVQRKEGDKPKDFEFISPHALDPISATYLARSLDFKVGDQLRFEIFGGKSRYLVTLDIVARERVAVKKGEVEAYKIIPRLTNISSTGYAGRVRQATAWISTDEKRSVIKMTTQVFIGSVNLELVEEKG